MFCTTILNVVISIFTLTSQQSMKEDDIPIAHMDTHNVILKMEQ